MIDPVVPRNPRSVFSSVSSGSPNSIDESAGLPSLENQSSIDHGVVLMIRRFSTVRSSRFGATGIFPQQGYFFESLLFLFPAG